MMEGPNRWGDWAGGHSSSVDGLDTCIFDTLNICLLNFASDILRNQNTSQHYVLHVMARFFSSLRRRERWLQAELRLDKLTTNRQSQAQVCGRIIITIPLLLNLTFCLAQTSFPRSDMPHYWEILDTNVIINMLREIGVDDRYFIRGMTCKLYTRGAERSSAKGVLP